MGSEAATRSGPTRSGATVDRVVSAILGRIGTGDLSPGEQLRQEDLAEALGVSRVPVREALHALAEQGIVAHQKHRGFFVTKRSIAELAQFARMLELLEDEVVAAIDWPDGSVIGRLEEINARLSAVADDYDTAETFGFNREFHFMIFRLSPLTVMVDELDRLWRLAQPHIAAQMIAPEARRDRVDEHRAIIAALVARDRDRMIAACDRHRRRIGSHGRSGDPATVAGGSVGT